MSNQLLHKRGWDTNLSKKLLHEEQGDTYLSKKLLHEEQGPSLVDAPHFAGARNIRAVKNAVHHVLPVDQREVDQRVFKSGNL